MARSPTSAAAAKPLLVRCNCTNRDELVAKIKLLKRAAELATLLSMAKSELETVSRAEPELALVEDDLLAYDAGRNKRSIEAATDEITQLDRSLQQTYEVLGRVKAELRDLENDRRASSLRYDRAQIQADLHSAIAQLVTGDAAARSLERLRKKLENEGQTGTLKLASELSRPAHLREVSPHLGPDRREAPRRRRRTGTVAPR